LASAGAAIAALFVAAPGCSLGNVHVDNCGSDAECAMAFGAGSQCVAGYCTAPGAAEAGCTKTSPNGSCFACTPTTTTEYENACTSAHCIFFDDSKRLTKLTKDGGLPPLPPPPPMMDAGSDSGSDAGNDAGDAGGDAG